MKYDIKEVETLLKKVASKFVSDKEAEYFAELQVNNHVKKYPRTGGISGALKDLENWEELKGVSVEVEAEKSASLLYNFNGLAPSVKIKQIHDELEARAKEHGIAMVGIRNSLGMHSMNLWTDELARRGLVAISMFNGGPLAVIPHNGTRGILGTNPLSYSLPSDSGNVRTDMATSNIPFFQVMDAYKSGEPLPDHSAVDSDGMPTNDAKKAMDENEVVNLTPLGANMKGYSLVFLIEVLTGSFVNSLLSNDMSDDFIGSEHGGLILVMDISAFKNVTDFKKEVSGLVADIRMQKPKKGESEIPIPGFRGNKRLEDAKSEGKIEMDEKVYTKLTALASE